MATTTYVDSTFAVNAIGGRTDSAGVAVSDYTAEEARFLAQILSEGYLKPPDAFKVQAQDTPNMTVKVGSGTAKADYYAVDGDVGGQGTYVVRLDVASQNITIAAADASQVRTDEIYLVVRDDTYDAGGLGLPRLAYRKGDLGGGAPGPDAAWEAYALLASINVAALATSITNADITDERVGTSLIDTLFESDLFVEKATVDAKGDLLVGTAADTVARLGVGTNGQILTADSAQASGLQWATIAAGPSGAAHDEGPLFPATTSDVYVDIDAAFFVTLDVGESGIAIVALAAQAGSGTDEADLNCRMSGANTADEIFPWGVSVANISGSGGTFCGVIVLTGLTAGSTTFTPQFEISGSAPGDADMSFPQIDVVTF